MVMAPCTGLGCSSYKWRGTLARWSGHWTRHAECCHCLQRLETASPAQHPAPPSPSPSWWITPHWHQSCDASLVAGGCSACVISNCSALINRIVLGLGDGNSCGRCGELEMSSSWADKFVSVVGCLIRKSVSLLDDGNHITPAACRVIWRHSSAAGYQHTSPLPAQSYYFLLTITFASLQHSCAILLLLLAANSLR